MTNEDNTEETEVVPVKKTNWLAFILWVFAVICVFNVIALILVKLFMFPK